MSTYDYITSMTKNTLPYRPEKTKEQFIDEQIQGYVGTRDEIYKKEKELEQKYKELTNEFREKYRKEEKEIEYKFQKYCEEFYGTNILPEEIKQKIFSLAWEEGHSNGYYEVFQVYEKYADLGPVYFK